MFICLKFEKSPNKVILVLLSISKQLAVMPSILKFNEPQTLKHSLHLQLTRIQLDEKTFMKMMRIIPKIRSKINEDN